MPALAPERLSFAQYCAEHKKLDARTRAAFEADLRAAGTTFNYRTMNEWDQQFQLFSSADRRRRTRHG
jgi:hypothetical protein